MKRKHIVLYPDSCECTARERKTCIHACRPLYGGKLQDQVNQLADVRKRAEHRKHIKENRGGRDDRPAGTPGATKLYSRAEELGFTKRRTKYPLGKPLVVAMTEGRIAANAKAEIERTAAEKWHAISGFIFIHPCDFTIGKDVHWHRAGKTLRGTVVKVNDDMLRPAKVLRRGPVRYHYTPSVYDFCDKDGGKPCVCDLPIGQRTECQHKDDCPVPGMKRIMSGKPVTPYDVKPSKDQLAEAREWNRWAGSRVPCGPAAGSLMYGTCVGTDDLDLALALILRRIREGGTPT